MARYWVGGATGFLGSHLVRALTRAGHDVVAVSRSGGEEGRVPVQALDVHDVDAVARSAEGCDGAFVAVGKVSRDRADAEALYELHVRGTRRVLQGLRAAGIRRVVYASTSGTVAVGTDRTQVYDETHETPLEIIARFPYYRSKHYGELEALDANQPPDFEVVIVNPTLLLGPGDERESSTEDVRRFLEGNVPAAPAGGLSFVDVRDVAEAMIAAFEKGRPGERYLLSAQNLTVAAFFGRLSRISGVAAPALRLPRSRWMAVGSNELFNRALKKIGGQAPVDSVSIELGQYFWYCDPSKAERELGFAPRDPGRTLSDTVDDLVERGAVFPRVSL